MTEHRNEPGFEYVRTAIMTKGKRGGKATAAKKARQRGETWADL